MKATTEIGVFIASPGDTQIERDLIKKYIEEWNSTFGDDDRNIRLKVYRWEDDLPIRSDIDAQKAILEDLVQKCEIVTGMFWTRFGSTTKRAASGTLEEIEYCLKYKKNVILYFLDKPIKPSEVEKLREDLQKISEFKKKYQADNIYRIVSMSDPDKFRKDFFLDLNRNVKLVYEESKFYYNGQGSNSNANSSSHESASKDSEENWYQKSIKALIEMKLSEYDLPLAYKREISYDENIKLWRALVDVRHHDTLNKITRAREEAFNIKYGKYDYEIDLREKYKETWYAPIISILKNEGYSYSRKFTVLGAASNNGLELMQIFEPFTNANLSVLDLSNVAIKNGQRQYKTIKFIAGNMEDSTFANASVDVYVNLRSIHSSGVDIRMTLAECYRILKQDGLAIISVSNGYLTRNSLKKDEFVETKGMYDNRIEAFSTHKPYELIHKIREKLDNYGFRFIEIHTGETEIFIKAKK